MARSTAVAEGLGLRCRPLLETLADTLAWEVRQGPSRPRKAGLSAADELSLIGQARRDAGPASGRSIHTSVT
jgi:hypothetical protein